VNPSIAHVSDEQFEEQVLKSSEPVLVDFWAEWCGPCKMIAPILDDVATSYAGKLRVAKVNIDHNQKTPRNYNVRGIPTLMIFKDGKVQATQIGAVSKTQLTQLIDKTLACADWLSVLVRDLRTAAQSGAQFARQVRFPRGPGFAGAASAPRLARISRVTAS